MEVETVKISAWYEYKESDIREYPDGFWITFYSTNQGKRIQIRGPYVKKSFAVLDLEKLNQRWKPK